MSAITAIRLTLSVRPYSIIDAINRVAASTGSMGYAMAAGSADYNGHHVRVYWNEYRGYWLAEYQWGERVVLTRGSLENALRAAAREYGRGAKGASATAFVDLATMHVKATVADLEAAVAVAEGLGYVVERLTGADLEAERSKEYATVKAADWWTWKHASAAEAVRLEKQGFPAISALLAATDADDYMRRTFPNRRAANA